MKRSLKFKFKILLFSLIGLNALIIIFSLISLFKIKKSVDDLMVYNFDSIKAVNNMIEYSENQNLYLLNYIYNHEENYKDSFINSTDFFMDNYNIQNMRVKEIGELEVTKKINESYNAYLDSCNYILYKSENNDNNFKLKYYYDNIQINYINLRNNLKSLNEINTKALINRTQISESEIRLSFNFLFLICMLIIIFGIFAANRYLNKLLLPISKLQKSIKSFKDGNFSFESEINSKDEIGDLYKEFKNMSKRIEEFRNSTLGQLMEEKNKSLNIVKSISSPLIVLDSNFKCILINNSCENYFNIKEKEVIDRHILEFIPNDDLFDFIYKVKEEKSQNKTKIMFFEKENYVFNISVSTTTNRKSLLNGIIIYFQDITEIKKVEHLKHDFISTISHELKTPLTSIMMGASMLEEKGILDNKIESSKVIETLQEDSQNLLDLIDDLLKLTELEHEENFLNLEAADISDIVNNSIKTFLTISLSKNINIIFEKEKNIPLVYIDKEKFFWVINNLISNAIKYSFDGGDVYLSLKYKKDAVYFTVKDFGIGINDESIPKIFDKFYRDSDFCNGTGLGLPLSKKIVELHNGSISCESKLGEGSIFEVCIPDIGGNS